MVLFPNSKINLGLNIIRKRTDGYHDLETVFYPIGIRDALEVIESNDAKEGVNISFTGISISGAIEDNLSVKAYTLLKKDLPQLPAIKIHIHKAIPTGSGLGGGSADGAFMLRLLNQKFYLGLGDEQLLRYALQLGSDCPFFIINKPCLATGRGEFLEPIPVDLSPYKLVVVHPGIHISTAEAFSLLRPLSSSKSIKEIVQQPVETWKIELRNAFEEPVFKQYPAIKNIKSKMYESGALYASLTGSGSSVYGLFKKDEVLTYNFPENYFVKELIG